MSQTTGLFTKLIVADEEAMARYYGEVYGLKVIARVEGDNATTGERFREVMMSPSGNVGNSLVMFNFVDRPPPRDQQAMLGFITGDIEALAARIEAHGGKLVGPLRDMPEHGVRVQFSEDPEGALAENVETMPAAQ